MAEIRAVEVEAELKQIKTRTDGTVDLLLNLPEYCIPQAQKMLEWLNEMVRCVIEIKPNK